MRRYLSMIPVSVRLVLIGLIPAIFLVYLTFQVYDEKNDKLETLSSYRERIGQAQNLYGLIEALQNERKASFDYSFKKASLEAVRTTRAVTDSFFKLVDSSTQPVVQNYRKFTFIERIFETRNRMDTSTVSANTVIHNYSTAIFRLNTLNSVPSVGYFRPLYHGMAAQKLLTELSTYLGIIRSNIYNVLITRQYETETLMGTLGPYEVYKSYETEFKFKAAPDVVKQYENLLQRTDLKLTDDYMEKAFSSFSFDSSLTADEWWKISDNALRELSRLQKQVWANVRETIEETYQEEKQVRDRTLILFIGILLTIGILVGLLARSIVRMQRALAGYSNKMETLVKRRTASLEQSNDDLQRFASVVSHDLKEPVRKIRIFTERIQDTSGDALSPDNKLYLDKTGHAAARMTKMIDGILAYSSSASPAELFERTDLNQIARAAIADLELIIEQKSADVELHTMPLIEAAPVLMHQLFYNLLNNAVKFSKPGVVPGIKINSRKLSPAECRAINQRDCYEISFEDNGIGFAAEHAEKIFSAFTRLHSKDVYEGTGLGLSLCKRIVEYHHGSISGHSTGDGSVFKVILPEHQPLAEEA